MIDTKIIEVTPPDVPLEWLRGELGDLGSGMEQYPVLDFDWIWIAREDGILVGALFAAPIHGIPFLLRINVKPGSRPIVLRTLLGEVLRQLKTRGYQGFFTFLDSTEVSGLKLAKLAEHYGCQLIPWSGYVAAGRIK